MEGGGAVPPVYQTLSLISATGDDRNFRLYLQRLSKDTERAERDPQFRQAMARFYSLVASPQGGKAQEQRVRHIRQSA